MTRRTIISIFFFGLLVFEPVSVPAFETDQYNLPPEPLADIGEEVSEHIERKIYEAVAKVNGEIAYCLKCIEVRRKDCPFASSTRKQLDRLRSNEGITEEVFKALGSGTIVRTDLGNWMRKHRFRGQPDRYKPDYSESIFVLNPIVHSTLSATVKMFGTEFGIDKLEHFFQQGYQYYEIVQKETAAGHSEEDAIKKAIEWGQRTERTYYGLVASGVYSNADLYANYAGLRFYQGLARQMSIGGVVRSAPLRLDDGKWSFDASKLRENLIRPFITDHLNEALNPSSFRSTLVRSVRRAVRRNACPDWRRNRPEMSRSALERHSAELERWNGEDYGFTDRSRTVSLAEECFAKE